MTILTGYLFLLSIFGTSMITGHEEIASIIPEGFHYETTAYLTDSPLLHISAIVLIFLLGFLAVSHLNIPAPKNVGKLLIVLHLLITALMLIAIFICNYLPVTAQYWVLDSANRLINSDYSFWEQSGFSYIYPWLNSLTLFLVPEVAFFGMEGGATAFRIINLGMFILASYSFYGFCKETKLNGAITSILFIFYLPLELYIFFVYGNIACLSFSLYAIWMAVRYLNHNRITDAILCAVSISIAALFKDYALIMLAAILIVLTMHGITSRQWKKLIWLPIFIAIYLFCSTSVNLIIEGITKEEVPSGMDIYGHLTMGISEGTSDNGGRANGWYNNFTFDALAACGYDYDLYRAVTKEAFIQRSKTFLSDPSHILAFFAQKTASQWNNPTFQSIWIHQQMLTDDELADYSLYIDGSTANMIFYYIFNLVQSLILFGSLYYFVFESRKASLASLLPAIAFIGGFIFLLFWEAKAQYTLLFFVMLFPYAVTGLISLSGSLTNLVKSVSSKTDNAQTINSKRWYCSKEIIFLSLLLCIILILSVINTETINNTIKLGTDDDVYNYYLEQNVNYYNQYTGY